MARPPARNPRTLPISTILGFVIGVLGSLLAGVVQKYILDKVFLWVSTVVILSLVVISLFVGLWLEDRNITIPFRRWVPILATILATGTIILGVILSFVYNTLRPPTTYFLVDATDSMKPLFNEVSAEVTKSIIPNSRIGLRVYGGNISDVSGCGDNQQLIDPDIYSNPGAELQSRLSLIQPSGHSSLVEAVLAALHDLSSHDEPIKLTIITSGIDPICDPLEGGILQSQAKNIKSNINIVMIAVGNLDPSQARILESYALAFHGGYVHIPTPAQLPQVVQTISSYGSQDYLYSRPTPTPTP